MIESQDGNIFRVQVLGLPSSMSESSAEFTLTEGVDIFEGAHTTKQTFDTYSAWQVTGFDYGDGLGSVSFSDPSTLPNGTVPYAYPSEMIERGANADAGLGVSCETVLSYLRGETDHTIVRVSGLVTPRDDLFGPGQIHRVHAPEWLGIDQNLVCIGVTAEVDDTWFTQTLEYTG